MAKCPKCSNTTFIPVVHPGLDAKLIVCNNPECGAVVGASHEGELAEIKDRLTSMESNHKAIVDALDIIDESIRALEAEASNNSA